MGPIGPFSNQTYCLAVDIINADASAAKECEKAKDVVDQVTFE